MKTEWSPYWAAVYAAKYSAWHKSWVVDDPEHGGCIFASGKSQEEAERNAREKFERRPA